MTTSTLPSQEKKKDQPTTLFPFLYSQYTFGSRLKSSLPAPFSKLFFTSTNNMLAAAPTEEQVEHSYVSPLKKKMTLGKEQDYSEFRVVHDDELYMFFIQLDQHGTTAAICYLPTIKKNVIEVYHIEIPINYRHIGLGDKLVKQCLDWAKESGTSIIPTCPFVKRYLVYNSSNAHQSVIYSSSIVKSEKSNKC